MAPKAADKKPAPAKKAVAKKSTGGRKKGSKKAVESYKIYIYKVCAEAALHDCWVCISLQHQVCQSDLSLTLHSVFAGLEASSPRHWNLFQGHVNPELVHR